MHVFLCRVAASSSTPSSRPASSSTAAIDDDVSCREDRVGVEAGRDSVASVGLERLPGDKKDEDDHLPALVETLPIRGRTLGLLGPTNKLRLACFNFLVYPSTEPIILVLIILNAILLSIQSSRSLILTDPPTVYKGYFHAWEDFALFILFVVFTLEACARICVSGLLFDPEGHSLALPAAVEKVVSRGERAPNETLALPFRLSVTNAAAQTRRNAPYLRHSWSRIDATAILLFWAFFALAWAGVERGAHHIRIFRALSALRTARLLTITSGTTVILHSLKTAKPLLASVAYFVAFAMVLFSIIGVQTFKSSLRTCVPNATGGELETMFDNQFCSGFLDPVHFNKTGYIDANGQISPDIKGYICPFGQTCRESNTNPYQNFESFADITASSEHML